MKKTLVSLFIISMLSACSANPPPKDNVIESNSLTLKDGSTVTINYAYNQSVNDQGQMEQLNIVHPSHSVGTTSLIVFSTILQTFAGQGGTVKTFNKEDLVGTKTGLGTINKSYSYPKYLEILKDKLVMKEKNDYSETPLSFYPGRFYLVYDEMVGNDNYTLYVRFVTDFESRVWRNGTQHNFICSEKMTGKTEQEWKDNNYALAISEGKKLVDKCLSKLDETYFKTLSEQIQSEYNSQRKTQKQVKQ